MMRTGKSLEKWMLSESPFYNCIRSSIASRSFTLVVPKKSEITMTKHYYVYGFAHNDLEQVRSDVERALGVQLAPHDSMYRGGLYYRQGNSGAENLILQYNYNPEEGEYTEEQYPEYPILLYVNQPRDPSSIEKKIQEGLPSFKLLSHSIL